jgi:protein-S-isoprenylcysteine O-methyltransferase Ste14
MPWRSIDLCLWGVLVVVWLAAAPFSRRTVRKETFASRARYVGPAVLLGFVLSPNLSVPWLDARWLPQEPWVGALSVAVTATGIGWAIWARFTLGKNWSGTVTVKEDHELIQRGPYGITRHPIYTGALLGIAGTLLTYGTIRAAIVVPFAVVILSFKMGVEEKFMSDQFGDAYASYRRRVKALIPFVW